MEVNMGYEGLWNIYAKRPWVMELECECWNTHLLSGGVCKEYNNRVILV